MAVAASLIYILVAVRQYCGARFTWLPHLHPRALSSTLSAELGRPPEWVKGMRHVGGEGGVVEGPREAGDGVGLSLFA